MVGSRLICNIICNLYLKLASRHRRLAVPMSLSTNRHPPQEPKVLLEGLGCLARERFTSTRRIELTESSWASLSLIPRSFALSLTYDLDFETGSGLSCLVLQDDLVVPRVLPLCHLDGEAGVVGVRFSMHTVARLQDDLSQSQNKRERERITCISFGISTAMVS